MPQCTSNVLMVRPASFQFNEQTAESNDYQHETSKSEQESNRIAQQEFDDMVNLLEQNEINVLVIDDTPKPIKPDAIFPNNWICMFSNGDIHMFPMATKNRSAERRQDILDEIGEYFEINNIYNWSKYEEKDIALEATGSIVFNHLSKKAYACISPRTDENLFRKVCKEIGYEPIIFLAKNSNGTEQYHTNIVMCIGDGFAIICPRTIVEKSERNEVLKSLEEDGIEIIEITTDQLERSFAGNMLNLKNNNNESILVMSARAEKSLTAEQKKTIEKYATIVAPNINFIEEIGGGSARCMMAEIFLTEKE